MAVLTREQFISRRIGTTKTIDVEGLGTIRIRELTVAEVLELGALENGNQEAAKYVLMRGLVDDAGEPLLTPADEAAIHAMGVATMAKIVNAVMEFCGVKQGDAAPKA